MRWAYLETVMHRADLPGQAQQQLLEFAEAMSDEQAELLDRGIAEYQLNTCFDYKGYLDGIQAAFECPWQAQLIFALLLTEHTLLLYHRKGWDEHCFDALLHDLKVKNGECFAYYGCWGTFVARWFSRWFNLERVALERLQFEVRELKYGWRGFGAGTPVINVHIPSGGALDRAACLRDYAKAAEIFADRMDGATLFVCHSWLLDPHLPEFLPPTSRILQFQSDYDIIDFEQDTQGEFLWRLFGVPYDGVPQHLTERNSLERAYKQRLLSGGVIGEGYGVFCYDNKKV